MYQALFPVDLSNFNQKNIKIILNLALVKAGPETFFDQKKFLLSWLKPESHIKY